MDRKKLLDSLKSDLDNKMAEAEKQKKRVAEYFLDNGVEIVDSIRDTNESERKPSFIRRLINVLS